MRDGPRRSLPEAGTVAVAGPGPNEVIGVGRTSALAPPAENTPGGATILPGVPLPLWGRTSEPVQPDRSPSAAPPAPVPGVPSGRPVDAGDVPHPEGAWYDAVVEAGSVPDTQSEPDPQPEPQPEPQAPAEATRVDAASEAPASPEPGDDGLGPHDELAEALAAPVPALDPPLPAAPVAAAYAAAGAAPPNAPWGTEPVPAPQAPPPAPFPAPVPLAVPAVQSPSPVPAQAPTSPPVDLAPPVEGTTSPGPGSHRAPEPTAAAAGRSWTADRRPLVLLGALGGVLVLAAVAAFGWPGFLVAQDDSTGGGVAPAPAAAGAPVSLRTPTSAAGLSLVSGPAADALTKASGATSITGYAAPVSAVYGTGRTPVATVIAWTALTRGTPAELSTAFAGFQGATGKVVSAITPAPTGALGGRMSCGSSVVGTTPASVCFWSDDATFGAITVLRPTSAAQGVATATALRAAVEHRG